MMIANLIFPFKIREIYTGKAMHSCHSRKNFLKFCACLNAKIASDMVIIWSGTNFRINFRDGYVAKHFKTTFYGVHQDDGDCFVVYGKFKYFMRVKVMMTIFMIIMFAIPLLSDEPIFGIIGAYIFLQFFGFSLYLHDLLNRGNEEKILRLLNMDPHVSGTSDVSGVGPK